MLTFLTALLPSPSNRGREVVTFCLLSVSCYRGEEYLSRFFITGVSAQAATHCRAENADKDRLHPGPANVRRYRRCPRSRIRTSRRGNGPAHRTGNQPQTAPSQKPQRSDACPRNCISYTEVAALFLFLLTTLLLQIRSYKLCTEIRKSYSLPFLSVIIYTHHSTTLSSVNTTDSLATQGVSWLRQPTEFIVNLRLFRPRSVQDRYSPLRVVLSRCSLHLMRRPAAV